MTTMSTNCPSSIVSEQSRYNNISDQNNLKVCHIPNKYEKFLYSPNKEHNQINIHGFCLFFMIVSTSIFLYLIAGVILYDYMH